MNRIDLTKEFFENIVKQYDDIKDSFDFTHKYKHSYRVAKLSEEIAKYEGLDMEFSYIIGLLHDVGRFEQTRQGLNFGEDCSLDHGDYGSELLEKSDFMDRHFSKEEKSMIVKAVKNHNKLHIEEGLDETTMLYCHMIRDADKIDILRYNDTYYHFQDSALTPIVLDEYNRGEVVIHSHIKTLQDCLLGHLSLRFDINFASAKELAKPALKELENLCTHKDEIKNFS